MVAGGSGRPRRASARALAGALCLLLLGAAGGAQIRSLTDGVYTKEQAERGARLYRRICSECHRPEEYKGYLRRWVGMPVSLFLDTVRTSMPENNPGSLKPQQYVDVLTYIFAINGVPPGEQELPDERAVLDAIAIAVPPDDSGSR